jgi:hypothetical protein
MTEATERDIQDLRRLVVTLVTEADRILYGASGERAPATRRLK